jgi:hypothetical protein
MERLRLALSSYRDGYGQQVVEGGTQPGWRDFERAVASVFGGIAQENKYIFDILIPVQDELPYGLSCKTKAQQQGYVYMEMANSPAKFLARLDELDIDPKDNPEAAGPAIVELIGEWHKEAAPNVDVERSSYVVLTHDVEWEDFHLFWYPLEFPHTEELVWTMGASGKCITGRLGERKIWDWYPWSGGQLKYYPPFEWARWASEPFRLEMPEVETPTEKAKRYWPDLWPDEE